MSSYWMSPDDKWVLLASNKKKVTRSKMSRYLKTTLNLSTRGNNNNVTAQFLFARKTSDIPPEEICTDDVALT